MGYSWLWLLSSFANEAGMRIKISFDDKIKKGSKGNIRISPGASDIGTFW
jgi:NTP pyrophosphatase (non-canonical NTP hydrolase)